LIQKQQGLGRSFGQNRKTSVSGKSKANITTSQSDGSVRTWNIRRGRIANPTDVVTP
jgi:hypothetical protein